MATTLNRKQYNSEGSSTFLSLPCDSINETWNGEILCNQGLAGVNIKDAYELETLDIEGDGYSLGIFGLLNAVLTVQNQPRGVHPKIDEGVKVEGYHMQEGFLDYTEQSTPQLQPDGSTIFDVIRTYQYNYQEEELSHINNEEEWIKKFSTIAGLPPVLAIYKTSNIISLLRITLPKVLLDDRNSMLGYPLLKGNETVLTQLPYNVTQNILLKDWSENFFTDIGLNKSYFQSTPKDIILDSYGFVQSNIDLTNNNKVYFYDSELIKSFISIIPSNGEIISLVKDNLFPILGLIAICPKVSLSSGIILIGITIGVGGSDNQVIQIASNIFNTTQSNITTNYFISPDIYRIYNLEFLSSGIKNAEIGTSWLHPISAVFNRVDCLNKTLINIVTPQALSSEWNQGIKSIELCESLADSEDWAILLNNVSLGMKIKVYGSTFLGGVYSWTSGDWTAPSSGTYVLTGKGLYTVITKILEG